MKKRVHEMVKMLFGGAAPQPHNMDNITVEIPRISCELPIRRMSVKKCGELPRPALGRSNPAF